MSLVSLGTTVYLINSGMKETLGGLKGTENTSGLSDKAANKLSNVALTGAIKTTRINKRFRRRQLNCVKAVSLC